MTLNQSALLELTQMLRTADAGDPMRQLLGGMRLSSPNVPRFRSGLKKTGSDLRKRGGRYWV